MRQFKQVSSMIALLFVCVFAVDAQAFGGKNRGSSCGGCSTPVQGTPIYSTPVHSGCGGTVISYGAPVACAPYTYSAPLAPLYHGDCGTPVQGCGTVQSGCGTARGGLFHGQLFGGRRCK